MSIKIRLAEPAAAALERGACALCWTRTLCWAHDLDVFPILIFIHLYLYSFLYRQVGLNVEISAGVTVLFFAASKTFAGLTDPGLLNGSVFYLPALVALAVLAGWSGIRKTPAARTMIRVLAVFVVSLVFRTLDRELCAAVPIGTHFLWHLLNAVVLGLLVEVLLRITEAVGTDYRG